MTALRFRSAAVITVATLSALFGTLLVEAIAVITAGLEAEGVNVGFIESLLRVLGIVFFGIALFVGSIVTANVFSTVLSGHMRDIALLRLIGAPGNALRRRVIASGFGQGATGSLIGCAVGVLLTGTALEFAYAAGGMSRLEISLISPALAAPVLGVVATTTLASIVGSRSVLAVSPVQTTETLVESSWEERRKTRRLVASLLLIALGVALFTVGVVLGRATSAAVLAALAGGIVTSTGILVGAPVLIPPVLQLAGLVMGANPVPRLATRNSNQHPVRASRVTIGLGIGVTLVTMFATVLEQFRGLATSLAPIINAQDLNNMVDATTAILIGLVGFSALLAAVGMGSTLLQSVLQRRRELGLLRALGFTTAQVRWMIAAEAAQISLTATGVGLILGSLYGWAGAQAAFRSLAQGPLPSTLPIPVLAGVIVVTAGIALVSSLVAARAATHVTPVDALTRP